ncbi:MATE family efflux transporter [Pedobacter sp.]|uniref:MATE family efflux transporter n=1 Tax=Pedobacter sp. TaxID=1411316 RepID=UPI00396CC011
MLSYSFQKYKPYYNENLKLALPIVVSQLGHTLVHMADGIIVGHFAGTVQLAAVSLVNSLFMLILVLGLGISYGLTPLIAQANGSKDYGKCGRLLANSILINFIFAIILVALVYLVSFTLINHLGQSADVVEHAKPYLRLMGVSIIPLMIFQSFKQFTEGLGFTKQAMSISIWGNIVNIIFGIVFVKGMFGIEPMGVRGVGYATLIDRVAMAIAMGSYVFNSKRFIPYLGYFEFKAINFKKIKEIIKLGAPVAMQYSFEISAFSGAGIMIGTIGKVEQASHFTALSLAAFTYMLASGIASAATIKTGHNYGGKKFTDLRYSAIASYHVVLLFMGFTAILFIGANQFLPYIFTDDKMVVGLAAQLLIIAGFFQLFDGTQVVGLGVLRGIGDVNIPTFITFLSYWVVGIPLGYYVGIYHGVGVKGIWYGLTFGLLAASILLFWRFQVLSKKLSQVN